MIVVAPATADLMAKMANGHADDLATAVLLATTAKIVLAPAMNPRMWAHKATQRNLARLVADGVGSSVRMKEKWRKPTVRVSDAWQSRWRLPQRSANCLRPR